VKAANPPIEGVAPQNKSNNQFVPLFRILTAGTQSNLQQAVSNRISGLQHSDHSLISFPLPCITLSIRYGFPL
jgi:hypothetical protein